MSDAPIITLSVSLDNSETSELKRRLVTAHFLEHFSKAASYLAASLEQLETSGIPLTGRAHNLRLFLDQVLNVSSELPETLKSLTPDDFDLVRLMQEMVNPSTILITDALAPPKKEETPKEKVVPFKRPTTH